MLTADQTAQAAETRLLCHGEPLTKTVAGTSVSLQVDRAAYAQSVHGGLPCTSCHQDLAGAANADCLTCHGDPTLAVERNGRSVSLCVDPERYRATAHAEVVCAQCHTDVTPSHLRACETVQTPVRVDCGVCHAEQVGRHQASIHGTLAARNDPDAPTCLICHDHHASASKKLSESPTFPRYQHKLCGQCHQAGKPAARRSGRAQRPGAG